MGLVDRERESSVVRLMWMECDVMGALVNGASV
jgi:hypothetical protein